MSLNKLIPFFGNYKLRNISRKEIEQYKSKRIKVASGSTINRDLACMKKLFNQAIKEGYCEINPVKGVEFFKESKKALYYLSEEEAQKLLTACDTEAIRSFVLLGLNTGMRTQEMLSLKWNEVNMLDRTITLKDTKKGDYDTIPMNQTAHEYISKLDSEKSDYVISRPDGNRYQDVRRAWSRVLKKAEIKNCSPHILRHTFATTLVRQGADLMAVKELGRWSDLKLVEKYAHVGKEHRTRIFSLLDGRFTGDAKGDAVDKNEQNKN